MRTEFFVTLTPTLLYKKPENLKYENRIFCYTNSNAIVQETREYAARKSEMHFNIQPNKNK